MQMFFALALLALPIPAGAQAVSSVSDLYRMPPGAVGDALLPAGYPEIARVQFGSRGPVAAEFDRVYLFSIARPLTSDFCMQEQFSIRITPVPLMRDAPVPAMPQRIGEPTRETLYRFRSSAGCDGTRPHFRVSLGPVEQGLNAVRALKAAIDLAARDRLSSRSSTPRLPFALTCFHYIFSPCDAREMLAALDPGTLTGIVIPPPSQFEFYDDFGKAAARDEGRLFELDFDTPPLEALSVTMLVRDGRVTRMEIVLGRTSH